MVFSRMLETGQKRPVPPGDALKPTSLSATAFDRLRLRRWLSLSRPAPPVERRNKEVFFLENALNIKKQGSGRSKKDPGFPAGRRKL